MNIEDWNEISRFATAVIVGVLAAAPMARSEIVDAQTGGFTVRESTPIAAPAGRVWEALGQPGAWWDPSHTYSGDASNLSVVLKPGGLWQESLPDGGGAQHMVVVNVRPRHLLRLEGALGPLQALGATGHLTLSLEESGGVTVVTQTYDVGGHAPGGLDKLAAPVDRVLGEQLGRLKRYVETGSPH